MTKEELKRANELSEEINKLQSTVCILERSIEFEKNGGREKAHCNRDKFLSFLRFTNFASGIDEPKEAHIVLFHGISIHGNDLPVDLEMIEEIHQLVQKRLDRKEREFALLGGRRLEKV